MKHTAARKILSLLLALILTASLLPATVAKAAEPPVTQHLQRLGSLDLTAPTVPYCKTDGSWASVSPAENITDTQEGWAWYAVETGEYAAKTLILDGVYIGAFATEGLRVPDGTHIILTEGSVNTVYVEAFDGTSVTTGISAVGALTVSTTGGEAAMNITAHYGLQPNGETKLNNVNFNFSHPEDDHFSYALYGYAASVEINGGGMYTLSGAGGMETTYFRATDCTLNLTADSSQNALMTRESARFNNCTATFTGGLGANGVRCMGEVFSALDSTLTFTGQSRVIPHVYTYPGHGMHIDSTMTISNSVVTATAGQDANALYLDNQWNTPTVKNGSVLTLTSVNAPALCSEYETFGVGNSTVTARVTESGHAIHLPYGSLSVSGSTVTATAAGEGSAVFAKYSLGAADSTLNLTAGSKGGDGFTSTVSGDVLLNSSTVSVNAPAGAGLAAKRDLTANTSDLHITAAQTALSSTGNITLLNTTAKLQSADKTVLSAGGTISIAEAETPYNISGASVSGPLTGELSTTTITQTGSAPVVLSPKADTRPVVVHQVLPRTTQLNLDLQSLVTYQNVYGTTTTVDPRYNDITDCAEGWSWYCKPNEKYPARTLVLDGFTLDVTANGSQVLPVIQGISTLHLVRLGSGITIHLADGSKNTIAVHCDIDQTKEKHPSVLKFNALQVGGNCTLTGSGTLNLSATAEAYSYLCETYGLQGPWIYTAGKYHMAHAGTEGGELTVKSGTLKVHTAGPQDQGSALDNLTIDGGSVEFSSSSTEHSALSADNLTLHGGTLRIPSGGSNGLGSLSVRSLNVTGGSAYLNDFNANYTDISGGVLYGNIGYFVDLTVSGGILNANCTSYDVNLTGGVTSGVLHAYETIDIQDDACVIATEIAAQALNDSTPIDTGITMGTADKPLSVTNAKTDAGAVLTSLSGPQSFQSLTGTDYPNPLVINPHLAPDSCNTATWAAGEVQRAETLSLIPGTLRYLDMKESITREQFAMIAVLTYEALSGQPAPDPTGLKNPFRDTDSPWIIQAYHLNLVTGMTDVRYEPASTMTREQAATLLTRVYKRSAMAGWTLETDGNYKLSYTKPAPFADDAKIASWAKDNVYFMAANKVINGVGGNRFDPKGTASVQEALIIALRIIDTFGK